MNSDNDLLDQTHTIQQKPNSYFKSLKSPTLLAFFLIVAFLAGIVGYLLGIRNNQPVSPSPQATTITHISPTITQPLPYNPSPTPTQSQQPSITPLSTINTSNWLTYDPAIKDGVEKIITFKYPPTWMYDYSIDGGYGSFAPFYEYKKGKDSQTCDESYRLPLGQSICPGTPVVATVSLLTSHSSLNIEYNNETREEIIVDGYRGTKVSGIIKSGSYAGQGENTVIVPDPNFKGVRFAFKMRIKDSADEAIFNELLKTMDLNF